MAILKDPTGAVFAIWQAKQKQGMGVVGAEGSFSWADLNSPDPAKAAAVLFKPVRMANGEGRK